MSQTDQSDPSNEIVKGGCNSTPWLQTGREPNQLLHIDHMLFFIERQNLHVSGKQLIIAYM